MSVKRPTPPADDPVQLSALKPEASETERLREPEVNKLFRMVMKHEASDLHLKVGQPPMMRLRGDIVRTDMRPLAQDDMERLLLPNLKPNHRKILEEEGGVDFSYVVGNDEARFRVSLFRQRGRLSLVSRRVNILTIEDPIEFTFTDRKAYINQREIGLDTRDWSKALKDAVRQDPDVILVGELRDIETFEAAVHSAEDR